MEELGIPGIHQDSGAAAGELFSHVMLMVVYSQGYIISESLIYCLYNQHPLYTYFLGVANRVYESATS